MGEELTRARFEAHLGATFRVRLADGDEAALVLEAVEDQSSRDPQRPDGLPAPFALLFRAPPGVVLRHGMHELFCEAFGVVTLGIGAVVTPDADKGMLHEAVFG